MVIIVTYAEFGGYWDHVKPPLGDLLGPGTRVPTIIISPFAKKNSEDLRVAVVTGVNEPGAIVATSFSKKAGAHVAVLPYKGKGDRDVKLPSSPGGGALVPRGGGYVYQRSTVKDPSSAFPTSNGPTTPTIPNTAILTAPMAGRSIPHVPRQGEHNRHANHRHRVTPCPQPRQRAAIGEPVIQGNLWRASCETTRGLIQAA